MFKSPKEVTEFIDKFEEFIRAVVNNMHSPSVEDAMYLNRVRNKLQDTIENMAGVTTTVDESKTFACPDCGGPMLLRTNRQNGDKFWGCTKYPNCRGTRDSAGLSRAERQAELDKQNTVQDAGFSFNRKK